MTIARHALIVLAASTVCLGGPAVLATPSGPPIPTAAPTLAPHKALYVVTLTSSRAGGDYLDVTGKMALEFTDACEVWTTKQKSLLRTTSADGSEELSSSDFMASETKAGDNYTFSARQTQNGDTSEFQGRARRKQPGDSGVVVYTKPDRKRYKLPPHFLFQTAQQVKLIEYAQKGGRFFSGDMFDGSEGGGAAHFNAVDLKPANHQPASAVKSPLLDSPAHRWRIAFYPAAGTGGESAGDTGQLAVDSGEEPEYEMTMTLHDNGVVSDYDYDYQDFSVHGSLEAIQALPRARC